MKKLLFIAFYFNQENEIASKRLKALAFNLKSFNWEPIVLVPKLDNFKNSDIKIIQTDYIDMADKWLKRDKDKKTNNNPSNNSKLMHLAGEIFAYPDGMKYWYKPCFKAASKIIENETIDTIVSSSWPVTSHIIAHNLKKRFKIPWIADLRDLWNMNPYVHHTFIRNYFEKRLETKTFDNVDLLTTTSPSSSKILKKLHPNKEVKTLLSGYNPNDFKNLKTFKRDDKLRFLYAGSLYSGKRDPSLFFNSLNQLINEKKIDKNKIIIDFYGDNDNLKDLAIKYNIEDIINIHGKIPYEDVLNEENNADILLLISWINEKEKIFIPGKIYEYMALKKPVLSIGYKDGDLKNLIKKTNIGLHTSNIDETKIAIYKYYNEFIQNKKIEYNGNIEEFSNYNMCKNFTDLLNKVSR